MSCNCLIWLSYDTNTFGSYIVTNGNVIITAYPNFSPPTYVDPQSNIADVGYDTLAIAFGTDPSQNSWSRTQITPTPQQMLHVKIKVKGCNSSSLAALDASFMQIFATYTLNQNDSILDALNYNNVYFSGSIDYSPCPVTINPLPPINAGTNAKSIPENSSILTINGSGFGSSEGFVLAPNANRGGANNITLDNVDILSWSDNQIIIKMPSDMFGTQDTMSPGSGLLSVINACADIGGQYLTINYNIENYMRSTEKLRENISMVNDTASLLFRCDTSITNHPQIQAVVLQAIETWNCYTGVNWKMGKDTIGDTIPKLDGVSSIYFTNSLPPHVLMETFPNIDTTCNNLGDSMMFVYDADIAISRIPYPGCVWNYNTSDTLFPGNPHHYFFDVLMHEFGHAHMLGHVDDPTALMFWGFDTNQRRTILDGMPPGPQTLYGGYDVVSTDSAFTNACKHGTLKNVPRVCVDHTLDVPSIAGNPYNLNLYPNPASNGNITIAYQLNANSQVQFKISDCTARVVIVQPEQQESAGTHSEQINIGALTQGVYLFIADINGETKIIKFIKI